jgi:PEGA domain
VEERKPEPRPLEQTGNLQVSVNVNEARVSLDGTEVGIARNAVPLILRDVPAGEHRLRIDATGYVPEERRITIVADEWAMEGVTLHQPTAAPLKQ